MDEALAARVMAELEANPEWVARMREADAEFYCYEMAVDAGVQWEWASRQLGWERIDMAELRRRFA